MKFGTAVKSGLLKTFTISGRASRSEYWWFMLFMFLIWIVPTLGALLLGADRAYVDAILSAVFVAQLLTMIPECTLSTRRLHDIGKSGWWQLAYFVPLIGPLVLLFWMLQRGDSGSNRFGSDPLGPWDEAFVAEG